jgi:hypothetical protein
MTKTRKKKPITVGKGHGLNEMAYSQSNESVGQRKHETCFTNPNLTGIYSFFHVDHIAHTFTRPLEYLLRRVDVGTRHSAQTMALQKDKEHHPSLAQSTGSYTSHQQQ